MPSSLSSDQFRSMLHVVQSRAANRDWQGAIAHTDELLSLLQEAPITDETFTWPAQAWLLKGNLVRDARAGNADECYGKALASLPEGLHRPEHLNLVANLWTNRGIAKLDASTAEDVQMAVDYFQKAIELRQGLPMNESALYPWGLSAAWMNRADALMRLDAAKNRQQALDHYQEALKVLAAMKPGDHPSLPARVALAWMNLGLLSAEGEQESKRSRQALDAAVQIAGSETANGNQECRRVLIGALLARGGTVLPFDPSQSWQDAQDSLSLSSPLEQRELLAAEASIKARHLLCQVVTRQPSVVKEDWVTETTDAVDDGMKLGRFWRQHGEKRLDLWGCELFRFGLLVYQIWQPHFLAEFILECIDPDVSEGAPVDNPAMHHLATEMIWRAVVALNKEAKARNEGAEDAARRDLLMQRLYDLQEAEQRLQVLRGKYNINIKQAAAPAAA